MNVVEKGFPFDTSQQANVPDAAFSIKERKIIIIMTMTVVVTTVKMIGTNVISVESL